MAWGTYWTVETNQPMAFELLRGCDEARERIMRVLLWAATATIIVVTRWIRNEFAHEMLNDDCM